MKGRNSTVISIRIPDSVYTTIKQRCNGQSVPDYIKGLVIHSVYTIRDKKGEAPLEEEVNLVTKLEKVGLNIGSDGMVDLTQSTIRPLGEGTSTRIPLYNKRIHKPGDRVIKNGQETIVPELDGEGSIIHEY